MRVVMRRFWIKVVDVDIERKVLVLGLKEKDEEEKFSVGIEEGERLLDGRCS